MQSVTKKIVLGSLIGLLLGLSSNVFACCSYGCPCNAPANQSSTK